MSILAKRLKEARNKAGYKQIDAAKKLGISNGTLSGYERDYRDPDTEILHQMANLYEVSVDWLLGNTQKSWSEKEIEEKFDKLEDGDLEAFIKNVRVWYKNEPESRDEVLKMMKKMFQEFSED